MSVRLEAGDMLEVIPRLVAEGVVCDSVVTDAPYHLTATQKRFGAANSAAAQYGKDGAMSRLSGGFMGQKWDGGDLAFRSETWATVATILRPGAFLIAFGGTRTYHRLVTAIEDAGFVIQDQVAWLFGSGFPKRRDMLKPAFEPIVLAYKPGGKRTMQVDECRIEAVNRDARGNHSPRPTDGTATSYDLGSGFAIGKTDLGRWPANVCHSGDEEVTEAFAAFGESKSDGRSFLKPAYDGLGGGAVFRESGPRLCHGHADSGSAARFFYCAKADKQDRWGSRHPTVKPVELMKWLVALVTPPVVLMCERCDNSQHENSTKTAGRVSPVRGLRNSVQTARQPSSPQVLFKDVREEGHGAATTPALRAMRDDIQAEPGISTAEVLFEEVQHEGRGGEASEGLCDVAARIPASTSAGPSEGDQIGLHNGAPASGRTEAGSPATALRSGASSQRSESGQPTGEPRGSGEGGARCYPQARTEADQMPALRRDDKGLGTCPTCGGYLTSRPGLVLDPFAGSGTTGVAALATGRDCILIEREEQYLNDIRERLAFYEGGGTHSVQAKNRSRAAHIREGDLFAEPSEPRRSVGEMYGSGRAPFAYDPVADGIGSHEAAISEIGRRVKSGEEDTPSSQYFAGRTSGATE